MAACSASGSTWIVSTVNMFAAKKATNSHCIQQSLSSVLLTAEPMEFYRLSLVHRRNLWPNIAKWTRKVVKNDQRMSKLSSAAERRGTSAAQPSSSSQVQYSHLQLTATLPYSMEAVSLGGQSDVQEGIGGSTNMCAGSNRRSTPSLRPNQKTCCTVRQARISNERENINTCCVTVASIRSAAIQQQLRLPDHARLQCSCMNAGLCSL